jgi:release factor glutamine methyltransferase
MRVKDWVKGARKVFLESDLRFLVKNTLGDSLPLILEEERLLAQEELSHLEEIKNLYLKGYPLPYLLGREEFFGLEFKVNPGVLIPRKETELIVEKSIEIIERYGLKDVLDLGCGCANISIVIKKLLSERVVVFSSDISFPALKVAWDNAQLHNTDIKLVNTDIFSSFKKKSFDLVISNPPYVESGAIRGSLRYEPRIALEAQDEGLYFIKEIITGAPAYLREGGFLILEIGYNQKEYVASFVKRIGLCEIVEWIRDYAGFWRGIILRKVESRKYRVEGGDG